MSEVKPQSDASVIAKFFGKKPGQGIKELNEEIKQLTPEDRLELRTAILESHNSAA